MDAVRKDEQIATKIMAQIASGECTGRLPAELELAKQHGVSPVTAAKALNILREKGLVTRVAGKGTFVTAPKKTVIRILYQGYLARHLFPLLEKRFPQISLEETLNLEDADAALFPTTLPFFYGEYFLPWPVERVERIRAERRLFPKIFGFHHLRGVTWGLPYLFSPNLLFYNRKLMRQVDPDFSPYELTFDSMAAYRSRLPKGIELLSRGDAVFLSLVYNLSGDGEATPQVFKEALRIHEKIGQKGAYQDFLDGKVLFSTGYRSLTLEFSADFEVAPMPALNGRRTCHAASEAFFVRNTTRHAELLFDLAEALFLPEVQTAISDARSIPADAAIAASGLDSRRFRDDIFFNEIESVDYAHHFMSGSACVCFSTAFKKLVGNLLTPAEFLDSLAEHFKYEKKQQKAAAAFLETQQIVNF